LFRRVKSILRSKFPRNRRPKDVKARRGLRGLFPERPRTSNSLPRQGNEAVREIEMRLHARAANPEASNRPTRSLLFIPRIERDRERSREIERDRKRDDRVVPPVQRRTSYSISVQSNGRPTRATFPPFRMSFFRYRITVGPAGAGNF